MDFHQVTGKSIPNLMNGVDIAIKWLYVLRFLFTALMAFISLKTMSLPPSPSHPYPCVNMLRSYLEHNPTDRRWNLFQQFGDTANTASTQWIMYGRWPQWVQSLRFLFVGLLQSWGIHISSEDSRRTEQPSYGKKECCRTGELR